MINDLDDLELESFLVPNIIIQNKEQIKRLEERKIMEESDLAIAKCLFGNEEDEIRILNNNKQEIKHSANVLKPKKFKQKELAKIIREK